MSAYSIDKVRRSLVHFLFGRGAVAVAGALLLLLIVRALDVGNYGFYVASQAALEMVVQVSSLGLVVLAQRYLPELRIKGEGKALIRLVVYLCVGRLLTLLLAVAMLWIAIDYFAASMRLEAYRTAMQLFLAVIVLEGFARYMDEVFDSLMKQGVGQVSMLCRTGLRLILLGAAFHASDANVSLERWIWIEITASLVACIWSLVWFTKYMMHARSSFPGVGEKLDLQRFLRYAPRQYMAGVMFMVSGPSSIKLIAGKVLSVSQYAAFGFAAAFAAMMQRYLPMFLLVRMVRPLFVAARQREDFAQRLPAMSSLVFKLNVFVLVPVAILFIVDGTGLAAVLTGGRYPDAGGYLSAFLLVLLAQALRAVSSLTAQAMEDSRAPFHGTFLGLLGLGAGLFLTQYLGAYGLCFGLVLSEVFFVVTVQYSLSRQGLRFAFDWKGYSFLLLSALVATLAAAGVCALFPHTTLLSLALAGGAGAIVFLAVAFAFKPFSTEERDTINRLLKRRVFVW